MNIFRKSCTVRNMLFASMAVFFLLSIESIGSKAEAAGTQLGEEKLVSVADVESGANAEPEQIEIIGTVDMVGKKSLVIDDSAINLPESIRFFDQYGKRISKESFGVGDRVLMIWSEDRDGTRKLISLSLMKPVKKAAEATGKSGTSQGQKLKKVNGVWTN